MHHLKHTLILLLILCCSCISACANQSTHEAKYTQMLSTSEELRQADQSIRETLAEAKEILTHDEYKQIEKIQKTWQQNEFAENVAAYQETGLTEAQAWAMEIGNHADNLNTAVALLHLRRTGQGIEGVYENFESWKGKDTSALLLIRKVDEGYSVTLEITSNVNRPPTQCTFSGAGEYKNAILQASTEDDPEAFARIKISGNTATVTASPSVNNDCEAKFRFDGTYKK